MAMLLALSACNSSHSSGRPSPSPTPSPVVTPTPGASPTPTPSTSPTPTPEPTSNALDCFNPRLYEVGASHQRTAGLTDRDQRQWVLTYDASVGSDSPENRPGVTRTTSQLGRYPAGDPSQGESQYYSADIASDQSGSVSVRILYESYGNTPYTDPPTSAPFQGGTTHHYKPGRAFPYTQEVGAGYRQMYAIETYPEIVLDTYIYRTEVDSTISFLGKQTVVVPAGTFDACVFDEVRDESWTSPYSALSSGSATVHARSWIGVGNGLLIRYERDGEVYELIDASIDGEPITGQ